MLALEGILETKVANEIAELAGQFFHTLEPEPQPESRPEDYPEAYPEANPEATGGDNTVEEVEDVGSPLIPNNTYF